MTKCSIFMGSQEPDPNVVDIDFVDEALVLPWDSFKERFLRPAFTQLISKELERRGRPLKTKDEIKATLPERFREIYEKSPVTPFTNLDDANVMHAYWFCAAQEQMDENVKLSASLFEGKTE